MCLYMFDDFSGYTAYNHICRDIFRHHSSGGNDGIIAYRHSGGNGHVSAYPHSFANMNGSMMQVLAFCGVVVVVEGSHYHAMTYQTAIANIYPPLILKVATGVDKHILTDMDIASEVGVERGEEAEILVYLLLGDPPENFADLLGRMELAVELKLQFTREVALMAHKLDQLVAFKGLALVDEFTEFLDCHNCFD